MTTTTGETMGMTGADLLWRVLEDEGVELVFGHPGGAILPVYDALYRHGRIRHVLVRHEQAAAHAADGYARATGDVGVCLATSGPGATNLVTGLATAMMDGVPIVAITGQVQRSVIGTQAFQETDIVGVVLPVTKHAFQIDRPEEIEGSLREAFALARSGRPGPVLVDIPKCVQQAFVRGDALERAPSRPPRLAPGVGRVQALESPNGRTVAPVQAGRSAQEWRSAVREAARLLGSAHRPVVMAGRGVVVSGTAPLLRALAERCALPVTTTLLGLDAFPAADSRALGMPGMHGTERANRALQEADLVIGLGLRFDDRVIGAPGTFAPHAHVVHFDVNPAAVGKTITPDLSIVADLRESLAALIAEVAKVADATDVPEVTEDTPVRNASRPDWWERLLEWQREVPLPMGDIDEEALGVLSARRALRAVAERVARSRAIVATDVGQHQMWMAQELRDADPGTHLTSGGLGTMGYALPAALGAALGAPDRTVWAVAGDGGFQMTLQELATVVQERIPLRIVVVNNGHLGMVRQWQALFYERRYSATPISSPDFPLLAAAYGIESCRATRPGELLEALDWAEGVQGPVLVELQVVHEDNVYPMVPTGAPLHEMLLEAPVEASR